MKTLNRGNSSKPACHLIRGRQAEHWARRYLIKRGLKHVQSNYRCRYGEIDLIMEHGDYLVFVEVRLRSNTRHGGARESIDWRKQAKLKVAAEHYLQRSTRYRNRPCRFDVVLYGSPDETECTWIRNAI